MSADTFRDPATIYGDMGTFIPEVSPPLKYGHVSPPQTEPAPTQWEGPGGSLNPPADKAQEILDSFRAAQRDHLPDIGKVILHARILTLHIHDPAAGLTVCQDIRFNRIDFRQGQAIVDVLEELNWKLDVALNASQPR